MKLRPMLALLVLLGVVTTAQADSSWILLLPPLKTSTPNSGPAATASWHSFVDAVDRLAPIAAWQRDEVFAGADSCEDTRLAHIDEFDAALVKHERASLSAVEREQLTNLARRAFSRCVPALALSATD